MEQLLVYLSENYAFLYDFIAKEIPCLKVFPLEGTYLVWMDARTIDADDKKIKGPFAGVGQIESLDIFNQETGPQVRGRARFRLHFEPHYP